MSLPAYCHPAVSEAFARRVAAATGRTMPPSATWLAEATHRQWLSRMLNNRQAVFARAGRQRDLFAMQQLQALVTM